MTSRSREVRPPVPLTPQVFSSLEASRASTQRAQTRQSMHVPTVPLGPHQRCCPRAWAPPHGCRAVRPPAGGDVSSSLGPDQDECASTTTVIDPPGFFPFINARPQRAGSPAPCPSAAGKLVLRPTFVRYVKNMESKAERGVSQHTVCTRLDSVASAVAGARSVLRGDRWRCAPGLVFCRWLPSRHRIRLPAMRQVM